MTAHIPLSARDKHSFTPLSIERLDRYVGQPDESLPVFTVHVPTYAQRDKIGSLLFRHGLIPLTQEHGRALLISEIYEVYALPDPETGQVPDGKQKGDPDEIAGFLESYWARADVYNDAIQKWSTQESERLIDQLHGAPERKGEDAPEPPYTVRESSRATRLSVEMLEFSEPYRKAQSRFGEEEANENLMLFRVFVAGWTNLSTLPVYDTMGKLTETCVEQLRLELDKDLGAHRAYLEIVQEIRSLFAIDKVTEKNSESPLGIGSSPSGSSEQSAALDASSGSSTTSNTGPARRSGSRKTSSTSSRSRSETGDKRPKASPTVVL